MLPLRQWLKVELERRQKVQRVKVDPRPADLLPPLDEKMGKRPWRPPRVVLELIYDPVSPP